MFRTQNFMGTEDYGRTHAVLFLREFPAASPELMEGPPSQRHYPEHFFS